MPTDSETNALRLAQARALAAKAQGALTAALLALSPDEIQTHLANATDFVFRAEAAAKDGE